MNHLKKIAFALAVAVALVLVGARTASADCNDNKPNVFNPGNGGVVHQEGTTELLATVLLTCTNGSNLGKTPQFTPNIPSVISVVFSAATKVTLGAGTTSIATFAATPTGEVNGVTLTGVTSTCPQPGTTTIVAPDLRTSFPCPGLTAAASSADHKNTYTAGSSVPIFTTSICTPSSGATPNNSGTCSNPAVVVNSTGTNNIIQVTFTACAANIAAPTTASNTVNPNTTGCLLASTNSGTASTSAVTFDAPPDDVTFGLTGIRISVPTTGLIAGSILTGTFVTDGGVGGSSNSVVFGIVQNTLNPISGTNNTGFNNTPIPVTILSCAPPITTPTGTPATTPTNPDPAAGANSFQANLIEGFIGAFSTAGTLDNGFPSEASAAQPWLGPGGVGNGLGNGLRLRANFTGIPTGFVIYAPEIVGGGAAAANGSISTGGLTVLKLVSGPNLDGSGGVVVSPASNLSTYDLITPTGGAASVIYEVTTSAGTLATEVAIVNISMTGTPTTGTGSVSAVISPAPVGPTTVSPELPQFAATGKPAVIATVTLCASYLLFPWAPSTGDGNYETGVAIANTTSDPSVIGTTGVPGDVNAYFFPSDGSASTTQTIATGLKPGATATFVVGTTLKKPFLGYIIVVCNFPLGHGFAFIDNPIGGQNGFAQGYLAISLTNPRLGGSLLSVESRGQ